MIEGCTPSRQHLSTGSLWRGCRAAAQLFRAPYSSCPNLVAMVVKKFYSRWLLSWWAGRDLNSRPCGHTLVSACKADVLTGVLSWIHVTRLNYRPTLVSTRNYASTLWLRMWTN